MLTTWLVSGALALAGSALYTGRRNWHFRWDRLLCISVTLQVAGFILTAPMFDDLMSRLADDISGIAQLDDFLGHMCFLASVIAIILSVAYRLMPNPQPMRRYTEGPTAIMSLLMLTAFTLSHATHQSRYRDFFQVPMDGWLRIYWVLFGLIGTYLVALLAYVFLAVRHEYPESKHVVDLYLLAIAIGSISGIAIFAHGFFAWPISPTWGWIPLCVASGTSFIAATWTMARNRV